MSDRILKVLVKGAGIAGIGLFVSKLLTYLYRAVVARLVGPEAYGQLSLGLVVLSLAITFSIMGMNQGLQNFVSKYRARQDEESLRGVILSVMRISIPMSIIAGIGIYFSAGFIAERIFESQGLVPILKVFAFVPPFAVFSKISISTTVGFQKIKYRVFTNQLFQPSVQLVATVGFVLLGYGVLGAAMGWLVGVVLSSLLAFHFMRKLISLSGDENHHHGKMLRYSMPLFLSGIIGTVLGWTDTAFLGYFMSDANVGLYNAALPTAMMIMVPYSALGSLSLPSLAEIVETDKGELAATMKILTRWTLYVTFPGFIVLALFSGPVLKLLFGPQYVSAAPVLLVLAFGYLFAASVGHLTDVIKSIDRTNILFRNSVANLILNIILNVVLIPTYGLMGAAVATASSLVFVNSLLLVETYYFEGFLPFSRNSWKPIASSIPGVAIIYFALKSMFTTVPVWVLPLGGMAFGLIYLVTLIGLNGFKEEDKEILISIGRKFNFEEPAEKVARHL